MLKTGATRKNKITLSDYNYQRDIENRQLMGKLSVFDVEVLEEILHSSIKFSIDALAGALDSDIESITPVLDRLSEIGLLTREGDWIHVDKEMRKYYDAQIDKFDDNFEPDMSFLQGLLRKVPIHILPQWYAIPRSSTNIFESIVDRFLISPRIYQRYLLELSFDDPVLNKIAQEVFTAPSFTIPTSELCERYDLSHEQLTEHLLMLEFSFVCCVSYRRDGDSWNEVVTPFHEWREYLRFLRDTRPAPLADQNSVIEMRSPELAFAADMRILLQTLAERDLPIATGDETIRHLLPPEEMATIVDAWDDVQVAPEQTAPYFSWMIDKLLLIDLAEISSGLLRITEEGRAWCSRPLKEIAHDVYRHPRNTLVSAATPPQLDRLLRDTERALTSIAYAGWVSFEALLKSFYAPVGEGHEVTLRKVGRKWAYALPTYGEDEKAIIQAVLFERLFEAGFVTTGRTGDTPVFAVTDFGRHMLSL